MRTVDYLLSALARLRVGHFFGVSGANIEDLYDAAFAAEEHDPQHAVRAIVAKHEFDAATMADGYARTTRRLGVVAATSGGGAMNLVAGLAEAFSSRIPVLALVGQPPTAGQGRGAFQDTSGRADTIDAQRLYETVSRYCARITAPAELPGHLRSAVRAALRGGPAVLLLPKDVQQAEVEVSAVSWPPAPAKDPDGEGFEQVETLLEQAQRIVIIAGQQIARDDSRAELARLVTALDASVAVAPDAKDAFDNDDPAFCGVAGTMGHPRVGDHLAKADACLLVGTPLPATAGAGLETPLAKIPIASVGVARPYRPTTHVTSTDLSKTLSRLTMSLPHRPITQHNNDPPTPLPVPPCEDGVGVDYRGLIDTVAAHLPSDPIVLADAGNIGAAVVHYLRVPPAGRFVVALGMGGMGYSFGAGIGACFGSLEEGNSPADHRRTVVIAGDGAFFLHGLEVHTAVEHQLPVTFVLANNNAHAMCVTREQLYYGDRYSYNRFAPAALGSGLAAMFDRLLVRSVAAPEQLPSALDDCLSAAGPAVLEVLCSPDEIPPFMPFLQE